MKKGVSFEALSSLDAPVSFWKGIPFGLQHVMAMFVANLAPIFLVATAAKMDAAQSAGRRSRHLPAAVRCVADWFPSADGHRHFLHLRRGRHVDRAASGLWRSRRRRGAWRPVGGRAWFDGQVLASFRSADRFRDCRHLDWFFAPVRRRHELRRRFRREGFRQLAESDAWPDFAGGLPCVPAAHEGHRQAAFRAVRPCRGLCGRDFHGQGRFLRFHQSAGRVGAAFHAVQA